MASIGNRNKDMKEKEEIIGTEDTSQKVLRYGFLSPNSIKYVMENLTVYKWESDTLLVTKSGYAYEIEIKISRADFKNDFKHKEKKHFFLEGKGMKDALGREYDDRWRPNYFYYAVPEGLISPDEVTVIECSLGKVVEEDGRVKGQVSIGPADSLYARLSLTCRIDD